MPDRSDEQRPYPGGVAAVFEVARRLRAPDGCPWDREQTHRSLRPYLLEETYETLEAIDAGDDDDHLMEELGDVLLQVAMHSAIAEQEGRFTAADVSEAEAAKMVSRHPHVFGDLQVATAEEVLRNWEANKAASAARAGQGAREQLILDRVPRTLPALAWTYNMQKRAARVGFEAPGPSPVDGLVQRTQAVRDAEAGSPQAETAVGDLLLAAVTLARSLNVNPEDALRAAGQRYRDRFGRMDRAIKDAGQDYRNTAPGVVAEAWSAAE